MELGVLNSFYAQGYSEVAILRILSAEHGRYVENSKLFSTSVKTQFLVNISNFKVVSAQNSS
jgi:hypothetical protein